ncbi:hypothetical protein DM860_017888 [Cuscuta australis]|uniref:UBZ4-type domain-containing protein n=1 Tax=Cuscuta australis TaxID=267555 RepID=A0A328DQX2_9ASTE|nr:hypothetical protein DM860_017888 [Cuscuta australis]
MDDVKGKFKGFMKKVNNQISSSSSSGKFKGQGRVLGSSSPGPATISTPSSTRPANPRPVPQQPKTREQKVDQNHEFRVNPEQKGHQRPEFPSADQRDGFDPYGSLITSGKRNPNGYELNVFECPVCGRGYGSEEEVSAHVDTCLSAEMSKASSSSNNGSEEKSELEMLVSSYISRSKNGSQEVMAKLLRNIVKEPENAKFRKIRMGNPKIKEAIADVAGGVELLESVGFELKDEDGEVWVAMDAPPEEERIVLLKKTLLLLDPAQPKKDENIRSSDLAKADEPAEPRKIDRQIRVFFAVPESVAAKIDLPDSFFNLSPEELKRESETRKKKIEESQLLIPKSYKEKMAKAAKKRHARTVIRFQFPDGVVLQGVFLPWEPTTSLYEAGDSTLPGRGRRRESEDAGGGGFGAFGIGKVQAS